MSDDLICACGHTLGAHERPQDGPQQPWGPCRQIVQHPGWNGVGVDVRRCDCAEAWPMEVTE